MPLNYEFKARTVRAEMLEDILLRESPQFIGEDNQVDTYFTVPHGRLKLREGNIENMLIQYHRSNEAAARVSDVLLYPYTPEPHLKQLLTEALGIKTIVAKRRRIYFVGNVKFHFDTVEGLGSFVEVEAIDRDGSIGIEKLQEQCAHYAALFGILPEDYIAVSYSDMLLQSTGRN